MSRSVTLVLESGKTPDLWYSREKEGDIQILVLCGLVELGNLLRVIGFLGCNFEQKRLVERRRLWPEARDEIWSMRLKSACIIACSEQ